MTDQAGQPMPPPPPPGGMNPPIGGFPSMSMPPPPGSFPSVPVPPEPPKKALTLEDLAKQTPIFSDDELAEDDFDPWAPLASAERSEAASSSSQDQAVPPVPARSEAIPPPVKAVPVQEPIAHDISMSDDIQNEYEEGDIGSVEPSTGENPFPELENEDGEGSLAHFFQSLNLDAKKIFGCLIAFAVILLLIFGLVMGGKALMKVLNEKKNAAPAEEQSEVVPPVSEPVVDEVVEKEEEEATSPDKSGSALDVSIESGVYVGSESLKDVPRAQGHSSDLTQLTQSEENVAVYIETLGSIRNLYETDVNDLMNRSRDRNATYTELLSSMKQVLETARKYIPEITARKTELETVFNELAVKKQAEEDLYFENLTENRAMATSKNLSNFIALAEKSVDIRARFRALDKIGDYMQRYTDALDTRIRDVELNREALIRGVRVYDVEGSDIRLIIPASNL